MERIREPPTLAPLKFDLPDSARTYRQWWDNDYVHAYDLTLAHLSKPRRNATSTKLSASASITK